MTDLTIAVMIGGILITTINGLVLIIINRVTASQTRHEAKTDESEKEIYKRVDKDRAENLSMREKNMEEIRGNQKTTDDNFHKVKTNIIKIGAHIDLPLGD